MIPTEKADLGSRLPHLQVPAVPRGPCSPLSPFCPSRPEEPSGPLSPFSPVGPRFPAGPRSPRLPILPVGPTLPFNPETEKNHGGIISAQLLNFFLCQFSVSVAHVKPIIGIVNENTKPHPMSSMKSLLVLEHGHLNSTVLT